MDDLLLEAGDWKELVKRTALNDAEPSAETFGCRATYRRLAGDAKGFEEALAGLRKLGGAGPIADYEDLYLAKVLFLNDRPKEAVDIFARSPNGEAMAIEVLAAQTKYKEALELADKAKTAEPEQAAALQILKARTLYLLGEKEKAKAIFDRYADQIKKGGASPWPEELIDAEMRVGLKDEAAEAAADALSFSTT